VLEGEFFLFFLQAREGVRLTVINPSFVFGPVLSARADSTSVKLMRSLLESSSASAPPGCFGLADVRDVLLRCRVGARFATRAA
jgi:hypothetical protein